MKIIKEIFLVEQGIQKKVSSPKNLTSHYEKELWKLYFDEICTWGEYAHFELQIERFKYHSDRHISTSLVEVLSKCVEVSKYFGEQSDWVVVPIPMHWTRYLLRGFHHTDLMAQGLSRILNLKVLSLLSTKWTKRQAKLSRWERMNNKKNSFFLKSRYTVPSHIILIDDVVSSWSTLNEAAKLLKEAWAKKVLCFTIASNA